MPLLILFAFIGGVVTILSPCILPILPIVLSGSVGGGKRKPLGIVVGFIGSFTFFTLFLTAIVKATGISPDTLRNLAVIVLALFGISLVVPKIQIWVEKLFSKLATKFSNPNNAQRDGFGGGVVVGLSIGLLWTPCVGPILASVISLALTSAVTLSALIITLAYALGTAIPMLAIMQGGRSLLQRVPGLMNHLGNIQKIFGVIMIITAIGIFYNIDRQFQTFVLEKFPQYGAGLTSLEDNDLIHKQLDSLGNDKTEEKSNNINDKINMDNAVLAPELIAGGEWLNSEPLTLEELRGKVVLLDFMTYSCINCIRTFPYLNKWYEKYQDDDFVIIGIHTPEFEFEKDFGNVQEALNDFGIQFPVMQDNDYSTWRAYGNRYWPRKYIIDYKGNIVYDHIGEGKYDETEQVIQALIQEKNEALGKSSTDLETLVQIDNAEIPEARSPETYFGSLRNQNFGSGQPFQSGVQTFSEPENILPNTLYLVGEWNIQGEYAEAVSADAKIIFRYLAKGAYVVADTADDNLANVSINLDNKPVTGDYKGRDVNDVGKVEIMPEKLYRLIESVKVEEHILEIQVESPGTRFFAFTFG